MIVFSIRGAWRYQNRPNRLSTINHKVQTMDKHCVRVHFSDNDTLTTTIHGTRVSVAQYYLGRVFNLGNGCGGDRLLRCCC